MKPPQLPYSRWAFHHVRELIAKLSSQALRLDAARIALTIRA
jgi:hypothetical protein